MATSDFYLIYQKLPSFCFPSGMGIGRSSQLVLLFVNSSVPVMPQPHVGNYNLFQRSCHNRKCCVLQ